MTNHRRALRSLRIVIALCSIVLLVAACNLGAPEAQTLPTQTGFTTLTVPATRTLIPGVPTSRVVTTTPIPFPTRIVQVFPTAYVPPQTNYQPTALPLPYSIVILSPLPGNVIAGNVQVLGSASHPQFLQYRLEFGPDPNPNNLWFPITGVVQTPLVNGPLGVWSTVAGGSPDGYYQIRLRVFMRDGSQQTTTVNNVRVQNQRPTPVPTATQNVQRPIAAFTQDYTTGNAPLVVRFFNQSQGQINNYLWNFGTGNLSSALNPIETFTRPGIYNVTLTVNGPGGTANVTRQINVTSPGAPTAAFIPNTLSGPAPLTVSFTNRSTGNINAYDWDFGDGTTSKEVNPKHVFKTVGNYNVILRATGPGGSNTAVRQITVSNPQIPAPVANFTPGVLTGQIPFSVTFSNTSTGQITSYLWDFDGNGLTDSTDKDPTFTYTAAGKFNVRLTAVGPGGQNTKTIQIDAKAPPNAPTANFTADPVSGTAPLAVQFTNTTTGDVTAYEWDFNGDGAPDSTEKDPSFSYVNAGTYTVRLRATGAGGTTQKELNISVSAPIPDAPVAAFTADPTSGQAPLTVIFTNTSTGQVDSFSWDFNGDGTGDNSVDGTVSFTYNTPGTYAAALTVSNSGGTDTEQVTVTVNAPPGAPTTSFTAEPATGDAPLSVTFTNTSTGTVDSLAWDFNNDGVIDSTAAGPVQFTYSIPGTYTAKLTATNSGGAASATQTITVETPLPAAPVASFTADPTTGDAPLTVNFINTSTGSISSLSWDFDGDGTPDNTEDSTASFVFNEPGTYQASLTVSNPGGENTATVEITVGEAAVELPVAAFTASPTSGDAPLTVTFTNTSTGTVDSLSWDFDGNGAADNTADNTATFTFEAAGTYEAALTVTNESGSDTEIVTITVLEPAVELPDAPVASFTANPTSGDAPLTVTFTNTSTGTVDSLSWDFDGNGAADNTADNTATFTFTTEGTYTATLTVTNAGGSDTEQVTITVGTAAPAAPVASFTANPTSGPAPLTVTFTNTSTGTVDSLSWDFNGDGTADNTADNTTTFTFPAEGTYTATLTVTNAGGSNTAQQTITVGAAIPEAPVAIFNADPMSGAAPLTVTFASTSTGTVDTLSWDFNGDGTADSAAQTATFTFDTAGTYNASLTVTNAGGSDTETAVITVTTALPDAPVAAFSANPTSGNAPLTVTFTNNTTGTVDSASWDFNGDGTSDSASTGVATFTYDTAGTYNATLTVTNAGGSDTETVVITVAEAIPNAPVAAFTANPTSGTAPLTVTFTNGSTGQVDSLSWDFNGDGQADNTADNTATFTYDVAGTYTASLTVNNAGGSNSTQQVITVGEPAPDAPVAGFTADPATGPAPLNVAFTSTSTGTVDSISWDFNGDGQADNTADTTATFLYDQPGTYTASVTVTNAGGSNTFSQVISVGEAIPAAPAASFTADPATGPAPLTVTFTSTSTGTVDSLSWDFDGNGSPDNISDTTTTFTYPAEGTYTASLTVTNAGGSNTFSQAIVVSAAAQPPTASFTANPTSGPAPLTVTFASTTTGQVDSLTWDFNGDTVTDDTNASSTFTYQAEGTFNVTLTVTGAGQTSTTSQTITVGAAAPNVPAGQIVYVSNNEIYLANTDGTGVQQLTSDTFNDQNITVSRDGTKVVFVSDRDGGQDLYVFPINDPANITRLTTSTTNESDPVWSFDGNLIAYVSTAEGGSTTDIYVMNADGTNQILLSTGTDASNESQPTWSPDNNRVAFVSDRDGNFEIYTMALDGNDATNPPRLTEDGQNDINPSWARDGSGIVFSSNRNGDYDIFVMQANGSGVQQLTESEADETEPTWSDDLQYIIYKTTADGGAIYIMKRDGTENALLTSGASTAVWRVTP